MRFAAIAFEGLALELALMRLVSDEGRGKPAPFAVVVSRAGGAVQTEAALIGNTRLTEVSPEARALGVRAGQTLAAAKAKLGTLLVRVVPQASISAALVSVAEMALAFGATTSFEAGGDAGDIVWVDVTGCAHLHASASDPEGERSLGEALVGAVLAMGYACRVAIADGARVAAAVARYGRPDPSDKASPMLVPVLGNARAMGRLPLVALGLSEGAFGWLTKLGVRRVADLQRLPRSGLATRLGSEAVRARVFPLLDGDDRTPLRPHVPPERPFERVVLEYGITHHEALFFVLKRLCDRLALRLEGRVKKAQKLLLRLEVDHAVSGAPPRDPTLPITLASPLSKADELFSVVRAKVLSPDGMARIAIEHEETGTMDVPILAMSPRGHSRGRRRERRAAPLRARSEGRSRAASHRGGALCRAGACFGRGPLARRHLGHRRTFTPRAFQGLLPAPHRFGLGVPRRRDDPSFARAQTRPPQRACVAARAAAGGPERTGRVVALAFGAGASPSRCVRGVLARSRGHEQRRRYRLGLGRWPHGGSVHPWMARLMGRVRIDPSSRLPYDEMTEGARPLEELPAVVLDPPPPPRIARPHGDFVHLSVRSNFSFLQGASSPAALVARAAELGYDVMALTDRDGLYGVVRAYEEANKLGLRLVLGCELTLDPEPDEALSLGGLARGSLLVHIESQAGYTNLCKILTESHDRHAEQKRGKGRDPHEAGPRNRFAGVPFSFIAEHAAGLWAMLPMPPLGLAQETLPALYAGLRDAFGERASLGVHRHFEGEDRARIEATASASAFYGLPVVATHAVLYAQRRDKRVHDVLHCIREGTTLDQAGRALTPNAEAHLKSEPEVRRAFAQLPEHEAWLARSRAIADACLFDLKQLTYRFPFEIDRPAFEGETADQALRRLTYEGAAERLPAPLPEDLALRIERELHVVARMQVAPYFLSVQSIVLIAREKHILCQGRGSAANSVVCFCLGITAVNPLESNMLFERFLSEERREPPDIDVDFEHDRREEVIQAIYARYGRDRAAMVCEVVSYRGKSALREVGKVFGFSLEQVDRLSGLVEWWDRLSEVDAVRIARAGFDPNDTRVAMALGMARAIVGFPRHLSIHVGGFVLSASPLVEVAPIEPATMEGRTIIPWDKDDLDTLGFFKVDVLGLGMLTALRKSLALIQDDPRVLAPWPGQQLASIPRKTLSCTPRSGRPTRWASFKSRAARRWRCCLA